MREIISRRNLFTRDLRPLRTAVSRAIAQCDPIRLFELGAPDDEYDQEITAILPRLAHTHDVMSVRTAVHEEFVRRFGDDVAGPPERYDEAAATIWAAVQRVREREIQ